MHPRIKPNDPALFPKETPRRAVLDDGTEITVLYRPGHDLYRAPGAPANFGGVADKSMPECNYFFMPLKDGRHLQLFINTASGLVVGDSVNKSETGGYEFLRMHTKHVQAA